MNRQKLQAHLITCLCLALFSSNTFASKEIDFSIFVPEKLSQNQFKFLEGPAWDGDKLIYFSDIPNNSIHSYNTKTGAFTKLLDDSKGANGLMFNRDAELVLCEQETGLISAYNLSTSKKRSLVDSYKGSRFNRPNDLVIDKEGGIYFTDPSWSNERPQRIKGVYYIKSDGELARIVEDMDKPNGIILSPDEKYLYIVDSAHYKIRRYTLKAPGVLGEMQVFAEMAYENARQASSADGLAMDSAGNLFVSYRHGVSVFSAEGKSLGVIKVPEGPSNLEFGGEKMNELYITTPTNLYRVTLPVTGLRFPQ